ncbi:6-pyruvoyl-tetrahydropterin synthase, isoform CRA_c [Chytriomyces sp. MP71]|nr:6-pyruvoyl-tetrahydropterin synthase, isoform CRA_c [Chytriomyces sp. MP71]
MVINLSTLRELMEKRVFAVFDHKHIDLDVPHFATHPSTAENIAVYVWNILEKEIQVQGSDDDHVSLYEVQVDETDENRAIYRGETE